MDSDSHGSSSTSSSSEEDHKHDLPLMANSHQVLLHHFALDLFCDLEAKVMSGCIYVWLDCYVPEENDKGIRTKHVFSLQEFQQTSRQRIRRRSFVDSGDCVTASPYQDLKSPLPQQHINYENTSQNQLYVQSNLITERCEAESSGKESPKILSHDAVSRQGHSVHCDLATTQDTMDAQKTHDMQSGAMDHCTNDFKIILDCSDLDISRVEEVLPCQDSALVYDNPHFSDLTTKFAHYRQLKTSPLQYSMEKWCLKVWKPGTEDQELFPQLLKITYKTQPGGKSLRWAVDQEDRPCVYSAAMWLNNRALFPCQEYGSLSTWEACIRARPGVAVIMSGDNQEQTLARGDDGDFEHYHQSSSPLPSFTLALAIGSWDHADLTPAHIMTETPGMPCPCHHSTKCNIQFSHQAVLPCRLFAPPALLQKFAAEIQDYYPKCCRAVQELLGPSPFPQVDLVIFPSCSQDMAMSNPGMIMLSQSMFPGDGSMCVRLGHELSHFWFGLLLGARDWTEEWLSEGFATFVEDGIHAQVMGWSEQKERDYGELRAVVRHSNLQAEMANTDHQLQTLRPNRGQALEDIHSADSIMYVKDGMNPSKQFTQVHYLKGYFLLRHLASLVGARKFNKVLYEYVVQHHGRMVSSQHFLDLAFKTFPKLREEGLTMENMYEDWLDCPGMPKHLVEFQVSDNNELYKDVMSELVKWKEVEDINRQRKRKRTKRKTNTNIQPAALDENQLVLLLEGLLELDSLHITTLQQLKSLLQLPTSNPDVWHRWCELVVKHRFTKGFADVSTFLLQNQAMGVYLYGEMMISRCRPLQNLARECFSKVCSQMEQGTYDTVHTMLYAP